MRWMKNRWCIGVVLLFTVAASLLGVGLAFAQSGQDRQLTAEAPVTGVLDSQAFVQTYWFEGSVGQIVTLFASTPDDGLELALFLTDTGGNLLGMDVDAATPGVASVADFALPQSGRYYVTVMRLSGAQSDGAGTFSLTLAATGEEPPPAATPLGDETPAPTETAQAQFAAPTLVQLDAGIEVALTWNSTADLDLEVRDPFGNSIYWENPAVENAIFDRNVNANCENTTADNPTEGIRWSPGGAATGSYEVIVYYIQGCDNNAPANLTLNVTVNGVALEPVVGTLLPGQEFLSSFVVAANGGATLGLSGVNPDSTLASTEGLLSGQIPIMSDASVEGVIDAQNWSQTYSFTGAAGQIVTIRMDAVAGNLDSKLFLLDPNGNVVAFNDDAVSGGTTNAEIANQTLVSDGLYTIVATRYGQQYGGTQGVYSLTLSGANAAALPAALAALDLPAGSIEVALLWNTNADLQLLVRDPSGSAVYDDRQTVNSGGRFYLDGNVGCVDTTTNPVSYTYWPPDRLPPGTYEVEVWYQASCNDTTPVTFNLTVRVRDQVILSTTGQPSPGQVYLTSFTVDVNGIASVGQGGMIGTSLPGQGIVPDSSMINIGDALPTAIPIAYDDTVSGTINQVNRYVVYTFEGEAGDQVRIGMQATAGNLDTTLFLLSPQGAQLAVNDDAVVNETTDSLINNVTLPENGTYIIIATHYGVLYGGTSGTYNLSLTRLN